MLFFFQAEDGIRYLVRSRGLGDVYKRRTQLDSLGSGDCASGLGDPIVLWDPLASRWMLSELSLIHI